MFRQVLIGLLLPWLPAAPLAADVRPDRAEAMAAALAPALQPGDLVFKGASTALWTELAANWSTGDKRWGHVGIIVMVPDEASGSPVVVHADTGPGNPSRQPVPGEEIGEVRAVPLEQFLRDVDEVGLFRLDLTEGELTRLVAFAEDAAAAHTPFDRGYSLASTNNLYCTELVWRAMSKGLGEDALPVKSQSMGRIYVALSDLSTHPLAEEVLVLDWREQDLNR